MLVKELIEKLKGFDLEQDIRFHCSVSGEMGSVSVCMDGDLELEFRDNVDPETGEDIEDGPLQILVLSIDGEETYYN
jgi:hypothetical protein